MLRVWTRSAGKWDVLRLTSPLRRNGHERIVTTHSCRLSRVQQYHGSPTLSNQDVVPLRKQLKDAAKTARATRNGLSQPVAETSTDQVDGWELTVGIEIHAQLNTARKLFSPAFTDPTIEPNTRLSDFDLSLPGSQPEFQYATLIPAIRAAIALNCEIQPVSQFDRKHYFYHDQPAGYQITQYYKPFARDGMIILDKSDGLPEGEKLYVGIKQVQMEQDTARTQEQDAETNLIDFNRAGHPLIEIISLPHIHSPRVAAAYVRKIQALLFSVDAVTTGMELGGLRADVNVSVQRVGDSNGSHSYSGVQGLGQRTEIKNLSTFKGVEDAIKAERDRQIALLESGGTVLGETRGWSITSPKETRRLRGKEGEVDYRYMPDPDIPPLYIGSDLVEHLAMTLPPLPVKLSEMLVKHYGLSGLDAQAMLALDDGARLIFYQHVVDELEAMQDSTGPGMTGQEIRKTAANWVLHELGSLLSADEQTWTPLLVPARAIARIIQLQSENKITGTSAKQVLKLVYNGDIRSVEDIVSSEGLTFTPLSNKEYEVLATKIIESFPDHVKDIQQKGKHGKIKFLVGQMMKEGEKGRVMANLAEETIRRRLLEN